MLAGIMSWGQFFTLLGGAAAVYYGYVMLRFGKVLWKSGPPPTSSKRVWHVETQEEPDEIDQTPVNENATLPNSLKAEPIHKPGFVFEPGPEEQALDTMSLVVDNIEILLENAGTDMDREQLLANITQEVASAPVLHAPPYRTMLANVITRKAAEVAGLELSTAEVDALIPAA